MTSVIGSVVMDTDELSDEDRATIAANCKRFRQEAGMTQEEVAVFGGFSIDAVRNWEYKRRTPERDTLSKLARLYKRSRDDFYMKVPPPASPVGFMARTKIVGEPPPGFEDELAELVKKYSPDKLDKHTATKAKLRKGKKR